MSAWSTEFPKKDGLYWFYGYRWGRTWDKKEKPSLCLVRARRISNGMLYSCDGTHMWEKEVKYPHFQPVKLPDLPDLKEPQEVKLDEILGE